MARKSEELEALDQIDTGVEGTTRITMVEVKSGNLAAVGWDRRTRILRIRFRSGPVYEYENVPKTVYLGLMAASSKNDYFEDYVKHMYEYRRVA